MIVSSYDYNFHYEVFLAEQAMNQFNIMSYIESCILNEESKEGKGFVGGIKELIQKLLNALKRMWAKFVERTNELFLQNKNFLKRYENIILKKPPLSRDIVMDTYDTNKLQNLKIPEFNYNEMKGLFGQDKNTEEVKKEFIEKYIDQAYRPDYDKKETVRDKIEQEVIKENVEIDGKNLPIREMYTFCMNFDKITEEIKRDFENLDKSEKELNKLITDYEAAQKEKEQKAKENEANSTEADKEQPKTDGSEADGKSASQLDSVGKGKRTLIKNTSKATVNTKRTIDTPKYKGDDVKESTFNRGYGIYGNMLSMNEDVSISKAKDSQEVSGRYTDNGTSNIDTKAVGDQLGDGDNLEKIKSNISVFFTVCGEILGAKLHCYEASYKDDIKLLKTHIRDYVKDVEDPDTKPQ